MKWILSLHFLNYFKLATYFEPIANNEEVIKEKAIGICSLKEKYDWNKHDNLYDSSDEDDTLDESIAFYGDTMSVGTIEDDFVMPTTYYDDHDWGDNYDTSCDLENLFESYDESIIDNNVCNTIESGFGEVMTLGSNDPTTFGECSIL